MTAVGPRTIETLGFDEFQSRLRRGDLAYRVGPFDLKVRAAVTGLDQPLFEQYRHYPVLEGARPYSCHVSLREVRSWRHWGRRNVRFAVDGRVPHEDLPADQALAVLEWGINLVVAVRFQRYLMLHAAVLERHGKAMLLPAAPGDGKTTLCVALAHRGWRLLSDEFGLLQPAAPHLLPVPRPMPLKNESIRVIREFAPDAFIGREIFGTKKGTVAHVRPPADSVSRATESALARWVVFPRWTVNASMRLEEIPKTEAFMRVASNAFNYELLGAAGFETVHAVVRGSRCFELTYSNLEEAVVALTALADEDAQ